MAPKQKKPSRSRPRREPLPPARLPGGRGSLDRADILAEFPGDDGVALWRAVRAVSLWAAGPAGEAAPLFAPGAAGRPGADGPGGLLAPPVRDALAEIAGWMRDPGRLARGQLRSVCHGVSAWAEQRGSLATAYEFAQAAAHLEPGAPLPAYVAGRMARRLGAWALAESWFDLARCAARRERNWRAYTLACIGCGRLHYQRGELERAQAFHLRALRVARRHSLRQSEAKALHDLFAVAVDRGLAHEAERRAREALHAYGPGNPKLPRLRYDLGYFYARGGRFAQALETAADLPRHFGYPAERLLALALVARAAAGAGDRARFDWARAQVAALGAASEAAEHRAAALLGVAYGAASLREWALAAEAAGEAERLAERRSEARVRDEAREVLAHARGETSPDAPEPRAARAR